MRNQAKITSAIIGLLMCGTLFYTGRTFYHQTHVYNPRAEIIAHQNQRIQHAMNHLGNENTGEANLAYHRYHHTLSFQITNYDFRNKYHGANLFHQLHYFRHYTKLPYVSYQVKLTKNAKHKHQIQLKEQASQRIENHIEAQKIIQAEQAKQRAIQRAKQARAKKKAQQKKAQQRKQHQNKINQMKKQRNNQHAKKNKPQKHHQQATIKPKHK